MAVITNIANLSQTAALNGPDGTVDPPSTLDDQCRYHGAFIAQLRDNQGFTVPFVSAGCIAMFGGTVQPNGWLACAGGAFSRTQYAALFAAVGTQWGAGDGSTTFNVPDFRGLFPRGFDAGRGIDAGRVFGSKQDHGFGTHTHGITDGGHGHGVSDPTHAHGVADPGHNHGLHDPGHSHSYTRTDFGGNYAQNAFNWQVFNAQVGAGTSGSGTGIWIDAAGTGIGIYGAGTGISIQGNGANVSVQANGIAETRPSNLACLFIIKT